jgi:hypothetical protein
MADLFQNPDGANYQARAVLAYLSHHDGIEKSWDKEAKCYLARPEVDRWHNCREQGYIVYLRSLDRSRQLNIAFFEHRNSDSICAVKWEQTSLNPINIGNATFAGSAYATDKYGTSHDESYGNASDMANWIFKELEKFWTETSSQ